MTSPRKSSHIEQSIRALLIAGVMAIIASAGLAQSTDSFTTSPLRIGFVDIDRVTTESPAINKLMSSMEGEVTKLQGQMETKRLEYEQLARDITQKEAIMTKEALAKKQAEMDILAQEMDDLKFEAERMVKQSRRKVVEPSMELISEAIRLVGKEHQYDIILRGEVILHGSRRTDLTKLVIHTIDELAKERDVFKENTTTFKSDEKSPPEESKSPE
jgi:outer membrane protein